MTDLAITLCWFCFIISTHSLIQNSVFFPLFLMKRPGQLSPDSRAASIHSRVYHLASSKDVYSHYLEEKPQEEETYKHFITVNLEACVWSVSLWFFQPLEWGNAQRRWPSYPQRQRRLSFNSIIIHNLSLTVENHTWFNEIMPAIAQT